MMHDPTGHPDDERLSALAAGDGEATNDRTLRGHVDACARCGAMVDDLLRLRVALAQLPDIAPPRPLRLLPGVPERSSSAGLGGFARRLFAPALAVGLLLVLAGGVGTYADHGIPLFTSAGAGAAPSAEAVDGGAAAPAAAPSGSGTTSDYATPDKEGARSASRGPAPPLREAVPWLAILAAGIALVLAALLARFVTRPRAG
jgi:hypothetical protein